MASSRGPRHAYEQSCRPAETALSRARATLAKRGHPPWPVRRLGAFAQRGRAHCASWTTCRQLFDLLFAQSARRIVPQRMLDVRRGGCWHNGKRHIWTLPTSTIPIHCQGRLEFIPSSRNGLCQVDSLTAPPAIATQREATRSLALRGKDQTADCKWPRKHSVLGLVAHKRRAGAYWPRPAPLAKGARAPAGRRSHSCVPESGVSHF